MRKFSLILVVLMLAAPAWATVTITCSQDANEVTVSYAVTGEPNKVRAFALDLVLDTTDVNFVVVDDTPTSDANYTIFPGSIVISDGEITELGSAVAAQSDYPDDTQPGLDSNGITIEMGALYYPTPDSSPNAPADSGVLLKFYVNPVLNCNLTITENQARGGVVLTNPALDPTVVAPGNGAPEFPILACLIGGNAHANEYNDWVAWDAPDCWCYERQCRGDIDGRRIVRYVQAVDLGIFRNAFFASDTALRDVNDGICADLDHRKIVRRVQAVDLGIFRDYFFQGVVPKCDETDVPKGYPDLYTGPYNYWTYP